MNYADSAETVYHMPAGMTCLSENALTLSSILLKYMGEFDIDESVTTFTGRAHDTGNAPIDTGDDPVRGRIAGEYKNHYALCLELTYHWN